MTDTNQTEFPFIRPQTGAPVPIVATDLEGTLTAGVTVMGIHRYLETHGRAAASKAIVRRRMAGYLLRKVLRRDLREYKNEWMRAVTRLFAGEPVSAVRAMGAWVVENITLKEIRHPVMAELNAHLAAGRRVIMVTGVYDLIIGHLVERIPGLEAIGTPVVVDGEMFTGELGAFNVGRVKVDNLRRLAGGTGRLFGAYGDTYSDLAMLSMAEQPVAVHPDRRLRAAARQAGWRILED